MTKTSPVFAALADSTRRAILESLRGEGKLAGEIARKFDISWPAISRHLRVLKEAGLIWETRDGRSRYYEVHQEALSAALLWLAQFRPVPVRQSGVPSQAPGSFGREYSS